MDKIIDWYNSLSTVYKGFFIAGVVLVFLAIVCAIIGIIYSASRSDDVEETTEQGADKYQEQIKQLKQDIAAEIKELKDKKIPDNSKDIDNLKKDLSDKIGNLEAKINGNGNSAPAPAVNEMFRTQIDDLYRRINDVKDSAKRDMEALLNRSSASPAPLAIQSDGCKAPTSNAGSAPLAIQPDGCKAPASNNQPSFFEYYRPWEIDRMKSELQEEKMARIARNEHMLSSAYHRPQLFGGGGNCYTNNDDDDDDYDEEVVDNTNVPPPVSPPSSNPLQGDASLISAYTQQANQLFKEINGIRNQLNNNAPSSNTRGQINNKGPWLNRGFVPQKRINNSTNNIGTDNFRGPSLFYRD